MATRRKQMTLALMTFVALPISLTAGLGAEGPRLSVDPVDFVPPGPNIALSKPYELNTDPNYTSQTGDSDRSKLTDGVYVPEDGRDRRMWVNPEAVGWCCRMVSVTIDLGETHAIGGVSYSSASDPVGGIGWPRTILVLVSEDGEDFRLAGDLVLLSAQYGAAPQQTGVAMRHQFVTDTLDTRGRYVQLVIPSGHFVIVDEIEVYEGDPSLLQRPATGPILADPVAEYTDNFTAYCIPAQIGADIAQAVEQIRLIPGPQAAKEQAVARLDDLYGRLVSNWGIPDMQYDADFRATAPLTDEHAEVFAALGEYYQAAGYPEHFVWHSNRWARQTPFDLPAAADASAPPDLSVRMMQNERRGEVVNITNFSDETRSALVSFNGLPGGGRPAFADIRQVEYVAMQSRMWDASALPPAEATPDGWRVELPAGISRQIWMDFQPQPATCSPGRYGAQLEVHIEGRGELQVPLEFVVEPLEMAEKRTVGVGMWDYTNYGGDFNLTPDNVPAAVEHMRASRLDMPWAYPKWRPTDPFPFLGGNPDRYPERYTDYFNEEGELVALPDRTDFDEWVAMWPDARYYMIYAAVGWDFAAASIASPWNPDQDTADFDHRLGQVMRAWADHIRGLGIDPSQIVILLYDEAHTEDNDLLMLQWARAIKAAVPEFKLITDPMYHFRNGFSPLTEEVFELMDIIVPTWFRRERIAPLYAPLFDDLVARGKKFGLYACVGGISEYCAISYYRVMQWYLWEYWKEHAEYTGFWAYAYAGVPSTWNMLWPYAHKNFSPVHFDSTSVVESKHWLAIFEGVQDYEYIVMLNRRLEELEQAGRQEETIAAARRLLEEVVAEVIANVGTHIGRASDIEACDRGRYRLLDMLVLSELAE